MANLQNPGQIAAVIKSKRDAVEKKKEKAREQELQEAKAALAFTRLDRNKDGVVDMAEYVREKKKMKKEEPIAHKVTADGNPEDLSGKEMIAKLEEKLSSARANRFNYLNLAYFLCYVALYLFILTEQRSTLRSFEVEEALKIAIFSEKTNTLELYSGEISENLDSVGHIWSWINRSLIQNVFTDPICGDGTCDVPQEFQQWESYGCAEDCGSVPRSKMTNLFVEVTAHFESDAELNAASWNLCSQTHDLCFYPTARKFATQNETQLVEMWLPDGVWEIAVDALNGGVSGRIYTENTTTVTSLRNVTATSAPTTAPTSNVTVDAGSNTNTTNVTRIRRLVENRQLASVNGSNASFTNVTIPLNTSNGSNMTDLYINSTNSTLGNLTNMSDTSANNLTNASFGNSSLVYNGTGTFGNWTNGTNVTTPQSVTNSSNSTSGGSNSTSSGSSNTNSSSNQILVSEVVKVQTDILSWSLCKDSSDSSVDHIVEYVNSTVVPRCRSAGVVYELCGSGERCPRCFNEFDCSSQSCKWDTAAQKCYDEVCANSELQCTECTDQTSCEAVGCLYDTIDGCFAGCNDCFACSEQACRLQESCYWDDWMWECYDLTCDKSDCSFCDEGSCNVLAGWCQWDIGQERCDQLYCEKDHCYRPMCLEPGECENTNGCSWDPTSNICSKSQVFLPLAETIVPVTPSAFSSVQVDEIFLDAVESEIRDVYKTEYTVIQNNPEEFQVVPSFHVLETGFTTLQVAAGSTLTTTDMEDFAAAFYRARCGAMPEEFCKLESMTPVRRRRLADQDLEVLVSVTLSTEFFTEFHKLPVNQRPLPTYSTEFVTRIGDELTAFSGTFTTPSVSFEVSMTVLTNLEESETKISYENRLNDVAGDPLVFETVLSRVTGTTSPISGPIDVDLCIRRDCSGHGTCNAGICNCVQGWMEIHCNYFQGQLFSQTTSNPTASTFATEAPTPPLSPVPTESPSSMVTGNGSATNGSSSNSNSTGEDPTDTPTMHPTTSPTFSPEAEADFELGDPVATVYIDVKMSVLEEEEVKSKITNGIWEVLLKDNVIMNSQASVVVMVIPEQSRTYTFSTPAAYVPTSHDADLLSGIREAVCGGIEQENCDVYYPNPGLQEVVVTVIYADEDFPMPPMFPDDGGFSNRLQAELQGAPSTPPLTGYIFTEDDAMPLATVEFYIVNETASSLFLQRVQAAAESHADIILEVKAALNWTGSLLQNMGTVTTDLCYRRLCSGNGYCSDGECICDTGFSGLSCSLSSSRRLQSTCSATLECAFCYDAMACDALPLCTYDWTEGLCAEESSLYYEEEIPFTAACVADSFADCEPDFIGNGWCDSACNIPSCGYDGGDCSDTANLLTYLCSDFCYCNMLNDQVCNPECNNALCGFDLGDCCVKTFTKRLTREFQLWSSSTPETVERLTPDPTVPRLRYLATTNRLIAGILLNQKRRSLDNCSDLRFPNLSKSGCFDGTFSEEPYGADPVFLRGTSLSDESLNKFAFYDSNNPDEVSPLGVPYGFHHVAIEGFEEDAGFPMFFDVNFGYDKGQDILNYGKEGFYLDDQTSLLTIQAVTYNPHYKLFASIDINLEFETGGRIRMRYDIQSIRVDMYSTKRDQLRFYAEVAFLVATVMDVLLELKDLLCRKRQGMTLSSYFASIWNYIDLMNILLMLYLSFIWLNFQTREFAVFAPMERFEVYNNINADARFLQFNEAEIKQMLRFFSDTKNLSTLLSNYVTGSACALVLLIMRILKVLDFQERMGIVTRTITNAAVDLFHWLILFGLIFFLYVYMGFLIFGTAILSFSTVERSFQTCFGILLGEIGVTEEMFNLPNKASVYIFYYTFIMIVFFVLINVFLAIIVDAYVDVKNKAENSESLPKEVVMLSKSLLKSLPCFRIGGKRYLADSEIVHILEEWLEEERNLTKIPEPQGSLDIDGFHLRHEILSGSLSKEMSKLKTMEKTTGPPGQSGRRHSAMMAHLLEHSDSERAIMDELSAKIADNLVHRYGQGFRRDAGGPSTKVQPALFSQDSKSKYTVPMSPLDEEPRERSSRVEPVSAKGRESEAKIDETLSSLRNAAQKEESLDSLDHLLEKDDFKLE